MDVPLHPFMASRSLVGEEATASACSREPRLENLAVGWSLRRGATTTRASAGASSAPGAAAGRLGGNSKPSASTLPRGVAAGPGPLLQKAAGARLRFGPQ